jgi:hypothetical protein
VEGVALGHHVDVGDGVFVLVGVKLGVIDGHHVGVYVGGGVILGHQVGDGEGVKGVGVKVFVTTGVLVG